MPSGFVVGCGYKFDKLGKTRGCLLGSLDGFGESQSVMHG